MMTLRKFLKRLALLLAAPKSLAGYKSPAKPKARDVDHEEWRAWVVARDMSIRRIRLNGALDVALAESRVDQKQLLAWHPIGNYRGWRDSA